MLRYISPNMSVMNSKIFKAFWSINKTSIMELSSSYDHYVYMWNDWINITKTIITLTCSTFQTLASSSTCGPCNEYHLSL